MSSNLLPPGQVNRRSVSCSRAQFFPDPKPTRPKAGEPQPIRALPQIHRVNGLQGGKSQYNPQNLGYGPRQSSSCYANFGKATADLPRGKGSHSKATIQPTNPRRGRLLSGVCGHSDKHAARKFLEAQCAFKILMIHEVLQFALRIAFRCVLHRCGNLDIRC